MTTPVARVKSNRRFGEGFTAQFIAEVKAASDFALKPSWSLFDDSPGRAIALKLEAAFTDSVAL